MEEKEVAPKWMVLARHLLMAGGVVDYGVAEIKDIFDSFDEADEYASALFERTNEGLQLPYVWVLKCEKTYQKGGMAVSKKE